MQIQALLDTLELQASAGSKGHVALYNCLVLGHNKYKGVQRVYCNPFPKKQFYGSHRLDPVMIRPPGIEPGGSWSRLILFGMLGSCSCSQPLLLQTQALSRSIVPSCQRWRHTTRTIRKMAIIWIKSIIYITIIMELF